jgi:hypothetical protein
MVESVERALLKGTERLDLARGNAHFWV